jgi:hypothetical protein
MEICVSVIRPRVVCSWLIMYLDEFYHLLGSASGVRQGHTRWPPFGSQQLALPGNLARINHIHAWWKDGISAVVPILVVIGTGRWRSHFPCHFPHKTYSLSCLIVLYGRPHSCTNSVSRLTMAHHLSLPPWASGAPQCLAHTSVHFCGRPCAWNAHVFFVVP